MSKTNYIGWDVGGWACSKSSKSCDAFVVLDKQGKPIGNPARESLKDILNDSKDTKEFLEEIYKLCNLEYENQKVVLAIDTPLGYSMSFINLISNHTPSDEKFEAYRDNTYLFRKTEQHLFNEKILNNKSKAVKPLSAVNDMIGAQSTKGIHVISKYANNFISTGVWSSDENKLTIIETYPSVNREIPIPVDFVIESGDIEDAFICAWIAFKFYNNRDELRDPLDDIPEKEGWIWYLKKG